MFMPIRNDLIVYSDPYLPVKGLGETIVCKQCGAVYRHKRWTLNGVKIASAGHSARWVICPGCRKVRDRFGSGTVTLHGPFWKSHRIEILNLIRHQEVRARAVNPLQRIMGMREEGPSMVLETTSERLAQRIGRELERAYHGRTLYRWSRDNKFVRVDWER
jgi:hypothetical protein